MKFPYWVPMVICLIGLVITISIWVYSSYDWEWNFPPSFILTEQLEKELNDMNLRERLNLKIRIEKLFK